MRLPASVHYIVMMLTFNYVKHRPFHSRFTCDHGHVNEPSPLIDCLSVCVWATKTHTHFIIDIDFPVTQTVRTIFLLLLLEVTAYLCVWTRYTPLDSRWQRPINHLFIDCPSICSNRSSNRAKAIPFISIAFLLVTDVVRKQSLWVILVQTIKLGQKVWV